MSTIYISEPDKIDIELVNQRLQGTPYTVIAGDVHFSGDSPKDCDVVLIRSETNIRSNIRDYFPNLQAVVRVGTGLDNVDTSFCKAHGIAVYNAAGANADAVAEYVVTMLLYVLRKLYTIRPEDVIGWNRMKFVGEDIASQTVGIIGHGAIGKRLQHKLAGLEAQRFLIHDPYLEPGTKLPDSVTPVDLTQLLQQSTVVSLHLPLTHSTRSIIGKSNMHRLRQGAVLINTSRGGIVDEQELLNVIDEKQLIYIADTVDGEPTVNPKLLTHDNVIITPHIASLTRASQENMVTLALDNFLSGTTAIITD